MALKTKIIVQQILNIDDTTTTASKYPKYTVVLGNSISSITAGELTAAVEASAASAAAAKDSEVAAKLSEINARDSENKAAIYADSSEASATQSATSATEAERQAGLSKDSADASAASATEAGTYKDAAELAAQNAEKSRELAEQAKTAAQQAQVAAETAKAGAETAETNAEASATTAGEHAAAAKQSELNAKTSETNAAAHEVEAGNQAGNATTEADRAKAEADRAAQVVDGKLDKVDISGFIKVYKTKAEADADVGSRVLGEKILVWNQTDSKYGWYKVAGTVEAPVLELVETEQKLVSINNVHADDAGNVQITLPGGNPSLWLGEVTWFPYDKDSGVGYPGVLPADGREVLRVDYPDTWEAIEAGLIPSVTEEQWQAGATLYFSTGNGTTTFRLPDMMQGQAFRAAAKGEENAGNIKEQIPYITMINGKAPADDGTITLGNAADKNVWNGVDGEVLLRGAFGLGGAGLILNEPDAVSFFKAIRAFGSGYYRNDNESNLVIPKYSAGFYSKVGDTHTFICSAYSNGVAFVASASDRDLDEESTVHTNILYGTANKPDLNNDTQGVLGVDKGGTGASDVTNARTNLQIERIKQQDNGTFIAGNLSTHGLFTRDNNSWGMMEFSSGATIPLDINAGGTGAKTIEGARNNLQLGITQNVQFANLNLTNSDNLAESNGGVLNSVLANPAGVTRALGRFFSELRSDGIPKVVIHSGNGADQNAYLSFFANGLLSGIDTLGVTNKTRTNTLAVADRMTLATPGDSNILGARSIALGDNDSGIKWDQDGHISTYSDGLQIFQWTPTTLNTYKVISSRVPNDGRGMYVYGTRTVGHNALIAGQVEGGGFGGWRDRATGLLVELTHQDAAFSIWKATKWGLDHQGSMDVVMYAGGGYETRLNVKGAFYSFNEAGYASCVQWVSTSDIRLKAQLKEIVSAKDKVKSLQGYTYFKRNNLEEDDNSFYSEEAGLIAQDVQTVLPEAVYKVSNTEYLGISYSGVTALLTNALKEMITDAEAQETRISKLEQEVQELKALVATLVNK
ncbi:lateral tail fiber protein [Escherichia phage GreteKellenberger]|uniref:Lateral tail fiber protein n=1 Tax=Escherichia phage GreteKellenberger TaxID=2851990 RepID=A0AAE7VSG0_9CAUD|nr:lateral tail fiber protein [Escherichia phage GreteKellenberger]